MRLYALSETDIVQTLEHPEQMAQTSQGQPRAWRRFGRGWLAVTYTEEAGEWIVNYSVSKR